MPKPLVNYLQLVRAPAVFTSLSNILAAQLVATQGHPAWPVLALLGLASMALYSAGMVLNDCFDFEEDRRERPSRPLPSGRIALRTAWRLGWALMGIGVLLAGFVGMKPLVIALLLGGAVLAYDGGAKHTRLGPVVMGGCRYLNWLLGLSVVELDISHFGLALPVFLYVLALTALSAEETQAQNRRPVYACGLGLLACAGVIALLHFGGVLPHHWALAPLAAGLAYLAWRLRELIRNFTPAAIQGTMKTLILGIIPVDALLVFSGAPWWGGVLVASLLVPGSLLARRMKVT